MKHEPSEMGVMVQEESENSLDPENKRDMSPKIRRLRRCKSLSRAEEIVTEDEKQRRAQPDKPLVNNNFH